MELRYAHRWDVTPREAIAIQQELAAHVDRSEGVAPLRRVAGVDVGFEDSGRTVRAAVAVLSFPELQLVEYQIARLPTAFPYVPGLLSFRECPAALKALEQLSELPDLLLCDGQGIAHPRRFGIACHLGVLTDLPAVGVAKSRLIGEHDALPAAKGCWVPLHDRDETVGAVLRTRSGVRPVYVSPGHRVSLPYAVDFVLACTTRYRLPETTRWADGLASGKAAYLKQLEAVSA